MKGLERLPTPALLVDLDILERNVAWMAARCRELGVSLRPHVKTHKCVEIASLQQELGARGLTVSTLPEARAFAAAGFRDLLWAFPVDQSRLQEACELATAADLGVVVDGAEAVAALEATRVPFRTWVKVDTGNHRVGVEACSPRIRELVDALCAAPRLRFAGLLSHAGHAYGARGGEAVAAIAEEDRRLMVETAEGLRSAGLEVPEVSVGSTPTMTRVRSLQGVTEARPGNYVFHDRTQVSLGSCGPGDCSATVLATVVSCQPGAGHAVVDAGALALSMDPGPRQEVPCMGEVLDLEGNPLGIRVAALSQEHGRLGGPLQVGRRVRILPNHSCLTAACFDRVHAHRKGAVAGVWRVHRQR